MASSLFGSPKSPQSPTQPNNMLQMISQFNTFRKQMAGQNPQAIVQNLLQSGQMSREQYNQLADMAKGLQNILK